MASVSVEEVKKHCWKVLEPSVDLPEGCELWEDRDLVHLIHGDKVLGTFSSFGADPIGISLLIAQEHL